MIMPVRLCVGCWTCRAYVLRRASNRITVFQIRIRSTRRIATCCANLLAASSILRAWRSPISATTITALHTIRWKRADYQWGAKLYDLGYRDAFYVRDLSPRAMHHELIDTYDHAIATGFEDAVAQHSGK